MNGKGDGRRPQAISDEEMAQRWAAIFQASEAAKNDNQQPESKEGLDDEQ